MRELKLKEQELAKFMSQDRKRKKKGRKQHVAPQVTLKPPQWALPPTTNVWICQTIQQLQHKKNLVERQASYLAASKIVPQAWVLHQAVSSEGRRRCLAGLEETEQFRTPEAACQALTLLSRLLLKSITPWTLEANIEAALQNVIKSQVHKSSSCKTEPQPEIYCYQNNAHQVQGEDR